MKKGLIGDIGRHRTGDGPGIRTVVFFKGCPLSCPWCHNTEFIAQQAELAVYPHRCINCGECRAICPHGALAINSTIVVDRSVCDCCGDCAGICPTGALAIVGKEYLLDDLVELVLRDRLYYQVSGGGVTLSGGEPTMQMEFVGKLLRRLRDEDIHTAIETNGFFHWDDFAVCLLPWLDLVLFDLKIAESVSHARVTGQTNDPILGNLERLVQGGHEVVVRIPLIPGFTANSANLADLSAEMKRIGVQKCELLPYHALGKLKATAIGRNVDRILPDTRMGGAEVAQWARYFKEFQVDCLQNHVWSV